MKQLLSCLESEFNLYNLTYNVEEDNDRRFWFLTETAVEVIGKKNQNSLTPNVWSKLKLYQIGLSISQIMFSIYRFLRKEANDIPMKPVIRCPYISYVYIYINFLSINYNKTITWIIINSSFIITANKTNLFMCKI